MNLDTLNDKQIEAVKTTEGPILILAGPGSGKTRVITHKIAYLLEEDKCNPWEILAITFTNKAAKEMKVRLESLIGDAAKGMQISTFHAFGLKIIKENYDFFHLNSTFTILDESDSISVIKKVLKDYANLSSEDKYSLILDIFENRQLKQSMEYLNENIIISTIHGAKGLEWEYVFIADVERRIFPNYFTCKECPQRDKFFERCKCRIVTPVEDQLKMKIIDELSVFYVGVTRARKQVYVSASANRYNSNCQKFSSGFSCFVNLPGIQLVNANKLK